MNDRTEMTAVETQFDAELARGWREAEVPPGVETAILAAAHARANGFLVRRQSRLRRWSAAAACFLVAGAALLGAWARWGGGDHLSGGGVLHTASASPQADADDFDWQEFDDRLFQLEVNFTLSRYVAEDVYARPYNF